MQTQQLRLLSQNQMAWRTPSRYTLKKLKLLIFFYLSYTADKTKQTQTNALFKKWSWLFLNDLECFVLSYFLKISFTIRIGSKWQNLAFLWQTAFATKVLLDSLLRCIRKARLQDCFWTAISTLFLTLPLPASLPTLSAFSNTFPWVPDGWFQEAPSHFPAINIITNQPVKFPPPRPCRNKLHLFSRSLINFNLI